jgi:hypothetical protein
MAYEVLRDIFMHQIEVQTLRERDRQVIDGKKLVFVSILRARDGILDGMLTARRVGGSYRPLPRPQNAGGRRTLLQDARRALHERDAWWWSTRCRPPGKVVAAVLGLAVFVVYASVRAFWGSAYYVPDYHYLTRFTHRASARRANRAPPTSASGWASSVVDTAGSHLAAVPAGVPTDLLLTTARPITARRGSHRRPARWRNRMAATLAKPGYR